MNLKTKFDFGDIVQSDIPEMSPRYKITGIKIQEGYREPEYECTTMNCTQVVTSLFWESELKKIN